MSRKSQPEQACNCRNLAPGCSHATMSTYKTRINGRKQKCGACSVRYLEASRRVA